MFNSLTQKLIEQNLTFKQYVQLLAADQLPVQENEVEELRVRIQTSQRQLSDLMLMTEKEREAWGDNSRTQRLDAWKNTLKVNRANRAKLSAMLGDAYNWSPPTTELITLSAKAKSGLITSINSIQDDAVILIHIKATDELTAQECFYQQVDALQDEISDLTEIHEQAIKRREEREAFLQEVDASVRNSLTVNVQIPKGFLEKAIHQCVEDKFGSIAAKDVVHDFASKFSSAHLVRGLITPNHLIPPATREAMLEAERQVIEAARCGHVVVGRLGEKGEAIYDNRLPTDQSTGC